MNPRCRRGPRQVLESAAALGSLGTWLPVLQSGPEVLSGEVGRDRLSRHRTIISHYFDRTGVMIWFSISALPVIYKHGIWLPRHGVNGWTDEPREKYYALRGWSPADR
jgi:hypothetical protein